MPTAALPTLAQQVPDDAFLLFGGANLDISCQIDTPAAARDSTPGRIRQTPGGVARNVAENLARLGHATRLFSAVGDDLAGRQLLQDTRACGVDTRGCRVMPGRTTATYVAVLGPRGDLSLGVNDMQTLEQLTPAHLSELSALMPAASQRMVDANLSPESLAWVFEQAAMSVVFADAVSAAKCRRLLPWLGRIHTLKLNRQELQSLSGKSVQTGRDLRAGAQWLHGQGVMHVVVSLGHEGLCWSERDGAHGRLPAAPAAVRQASGGGDALLAGLIHAHLAGQSLADAARFASACAALTMGSDGATTRTLSVAAAEHIARKQATAPA